MSHQALNACRAGLLVFALNACSGSSSDGASQSASTEPVAEGTSNGQTIVVYGASGKIGGLIVTEALERGHSVIGVSRNPDSLDVDHPAFLAVQGDVNDADSLGQTTRGADAVIISVGGGHAIPEATPHARAAVNAIAAFEGKDVAPYVLQIGGATTMHETPEAMRDNLPFPAEEGDPVYGMLFGHLVALEAYRASNIDWAVLTPPYEIKGWARDGITDRTRTGEYRTSISGFVVDEAGHSSIRVADLAAAAVDEIENRRFVRQRFTVGY